MEVKRVKIKGPDELDILSAIWILACNDENPIITYEGIKYRLGLPADYDVKSLIQSRGEMFRRGVPSRRLEGWKQIMLTGKHLPSWIRDIENESSRKATIEALTPEDVFRNQFRAEADAPRSPIEIIKWGLEHIDRLRKADVEAREEKVKRITGMWIPLLSMSIALAAIVSSAFLQNRSINTQIDLKKYETSFKPKQDGYASYMRSLIEAYENAYKGDVNALVVSLDKTEAAYYNLEPFLDENKRQAIWEQFQQFSGMCYELRAQPPESPKRSQFHDSFLWYKKYFHTQLYQALFGQ